MITPNYNTSPINGKKVWMEPTLVLISTDTINKGSHATHEASLAPTHKANGFTYSKFGNPIQSLPHYHS